MFKILDKLLALIPGDGKKLEISGIAVGVGGILQAVSYFIPELQPIADAVVEYGSYGAGVGLFHKPIKKIAR